MSLHRRRGGALRARLVVALLAVIVSTLAPASAQEVGDDADYSYVSDLPGDWDYGETSWDGSDPYGSCGGGGGGGGGGGSGGGGDLPPVESFAESSGVEAETTETTTDPADESTATEDQPAINDGYADYEAAYGGDATYTYSDQCGATSPVWKYAPLVYLHPDEDNFPAGARSFFIRHSELRWSHDWCRDHVIARRGSINTAALGDGRYWHNSGCPHSGSSYSTAHYTRPRGSEADRHGLSREEGFFLDLHNDRRGGVYDLGSAPVYYHYSPRDFVTYWFFYPYNDGWGTANHEGDWERISVNLNRNNIATEATYYRHTCNRTASWSSVWRAYRTHPVVFSALGAHGSYARPGTHENCSVPSLNDYTGYGPRWRTWNYLVSAPTQPWYGFGGAWGEVGETEFTTGPLGPSRYKSPDPYGSASAY